MDLLLELLQEPLLELLLVLLLLLLLYVFYHVHEGGRILSCHSGLYCLRSSTASRA